MISSYKEITWKYLKSNKKRTILTLIGIILSVALVSSIGFFLKSMQEAQIQDMKNNFGSWHIAYSKVNATLITKIKSNPNVLRSGTYAEGEEININDKVKAREVFVTEEAVKLLPITLKEGRFPEKKGEVALENWLLYKVNKDAKPGETIKVGSKEYDLVGILNDTFRSQISGEGQIISASSNVNSNRKILLAELQVNRKLGENIKELKRLSDEKSVMENSNLLAMQGEGFPKQLLGGLSVIIGIVVFATIAVIYNAFHISVVERVKQFGLLRAVGTTPRQIRKIILREATFLALIGIPIGLCCGIGALYGIDIAFKIIGKGQLVLIQPKITLDVLIISVIVGLISIYVSAMLPAIFAGRISPLVAINSRSSIAKENIKRRKSLIIGRIFGFEGALASKNIKRNRKRYRTTVFSIVISVTLFITFKAFMDISLNVYSELNESSNIHFSVVADNKTSKSNSVTIDEKIIDSIDKLSETDVTYKEYNPYYFYAVMDKNKELEDIKNVGGVYTDIKYKGQNKTLVNSSLIVYDDKSLNIAKEYIKEGAIDSEKLNSENGVIIIGKNRVYNEKTENNFYGPISGLKVGDEILLQSNEKRFSDSQDKVQFTDKDVKKVKVLAVLEGNPFDFTGVEKDLKIITTKNVAEKLLEKTIKPSGLNIKIKDAGLENVAKNRIENIISSAGDLKLINIIERNRMTKAAILMVKILLFGFVIVVSLIGCVNIINTLTTNLILRRREFAALKCIGLTQKELRKIVTLEGMLYGIVGSIYGSIIGTVFSYVIYRNINEVREQSYSLPIESIAIAVIGTMLIGYISIQAPLRRMKRDNLIDAVREEF
ncbi:ABC transporter permease YtrF precursor [Clostridium homopropionicum DSM 5847]|uniref:ABC transporter permease YtrF n=1 Tax=Clostridium homopropionicum DSM 5847 TaxID=1121318 RepID=A0A0L6Z9M3_9CLOT|nr:FtsX-like permease family protein [Clostridium homopropionicum]KOA19671.1 ABC transporter permease YtrF precursor [Clostridium homopropionicum DSM 5847]SFF80423.1 putative ABC transport system permease protein [Clostridium homopropionicum]